MPEENVSQDTIASLHAKRLMSGGTVSEGEARLIMAGLLLSVERLTRSFERFERSLWSRDQLHEMIVTEVTRHCDARRASCKAEMRALARQPKGGGSFWATWLGRFVGAVIRR